MGWDDTSSYCSSGNNCGSSGNQGMSWGSQNNQLLNGSNKDYEDVIVEYVEYH